MQVCLGDTIYKKQLLLHIWWNSSHKATKLHSFRNIILQVKKHKLAARWKGAFPRETECKTN